MNPLISIIVPVYNHREALKKALASIEAQTYRPIEVIIVDDGSDDGLRTTPARRSGGDFGLRTNLPLQLIRQEHQGAPAARNRGLAEAKGEYVIFWDADVVGEPEMLEKMKRMLDERLEASYVYSNFQFSIFNFQKFFSFKKRMPAREFVGEELKKNNFIHSTSLIRREDVVLWDESLERFQDWDLWLTMLEKGKTGVWVPEYLFTVLPHRHGMSTWLPAFVYRKPWKFLPFVRNAVKKYEEALGVVKRKHGL
ncbi:MAG: glycosyltransferase family A protein [Patescibacteria group bacterium]